MVFMFDTIEVSKALKKMFDKKKKKKKKKNPLSTILILPLPYTYTVGDNTS